MFKRIVSLAPSITETIAALGYEGLLVGRTEYCDRPESVLAVPCIGGFASVTVQAVRVLKPDLVIGSSIHLGLFKKLRDCGISTAMIPLYTAQQAPEMIQLVAKTIGACDGVKELVDNVQREIRDVLSEVRHHRSKKICYLCNMACPVWKTCTVPQAVTEVGCSLTGRQCDHTAGETVQMEAILDEEPELFIIPENHAKDTRQYLSGGTALNTYIEANTIPVKSFPSGLLERTGPSSGFALKRLLETIYGD